MPDFNQIIQFIISPNFSGWLLTLKTIFLVLTLIFLILILVFISRTSWLKIRFLFNLYEFFTYRPYGVKKIAKQWTKIKTRLETPLESEYKLAVIEADSMLDEVLKRMGYSGETMGERLKILTPDALTNLDEVWEAHKIRNNIVHDPDYRLSLDLAKRTISIYEKALIELGAL